MSLSMESSVKSNAAPRHDWRLEEVETLFALPFNDLLYRAQTVHRAQLHSARRDILSAL